MKDRTQPMQPAKIQLWVVGSWQLVYHLIKTLMTIFFFPLRLVPSVIHQEVNTDRSPNHFQLPENLGRGAK